MKEKNSQLTKAAWLLFYLYIILLSYFLFFSEHYGRDISKELQMNLELLKEIKRFIKYRNQLGLESFVVNIFGNIFAFAPFGFLLPLLKKNYRNIFFITFLTFIFSLSVELMQLNFKVGIFDVDDILLNTIGGIIGYLSFSISNFIYNHVRNRKSKEGGGKHVEKE